MVEILTKQERSEPKPQGAVSLRETFSEMQAGQVHNGEQPETLQQTETEDLFLEPCEDCDFHRRRCVIVKEDEGGSRAHSRRRTPGLRRSRLRHLGQLLWFPLCTCKRIPPGFW